MSQTYRILLCLRYGIGDVVMEMPALRGLRCQYPDAEIWLLGARPALELFQEDPDFDTLVCIQDFGFGHWGDLGNEPARQRFQSWLARAGFDLVLDPFHAVFGVQDLLTGSGIPWRNSSPVLRQPDSVTGGHGIAATWYSAVDAWGLKSQRDRSPPAPNLHIPEHARDAADRYLGHWTHPAGKLVGIAPIASSELKRWPIHQIVEVIHWLLRERGLRVLIFGVGPDQDLLRRRLSSTASPDDLAVVMPVHLQETAALAARCRAFLSNDTGLMHLAAVVGTPTVGIFGPTAPDIYLPHHSLAVASNRPCDYRLHEQFGPPQCVHADRCLIADEGCINDIPTGAVTLALDKLLRRQPQQRTTSTCHWSRTGSMGLEH